MAICSASCDWMHLHGVHCPLAAKEGQQIAHTLVLPSLAHWLTSLLQKLHVRHLMFRLPKQE
jgi:hypothetical protein